MVWPLARSKGGNNSSVAVLIAVEMKALISAAWAVAVAASMAMMIAIMRMTFPATVSYDLLSHWMNKEKLGSFCNHPGWDRGRHASRVRGQVHAALVIL